MLFNSYLFIFGFLPLVLVPFYSLGARRPGWAINWLIAASIVFYAWWRPVNVLLMAPSIGLNYLAARQIQRHVATRPGLARLWLVGGIVFNVCFLGYFKYLNFVSQAANDLFGAGFVLTHLILPLGISFITFQKIAFLIDVHAGRVERFSLRDYALFVLFFPQLIAGPIVHYREMMPQFHAATCRLDLENVTVGATLFTFGLAKKLVLADPMSLSVIPLYSAAAGGAQLSLFDGWIAAIGYTLQIYFDFSGYSDMALGLARLFGIRLTVNFMSPLQATSIIEFWLRWHVSLTRFLTGYLYNPIVLAITRRRAQAGKPLHGSSRTTTGAFATLLAFPTLLTMLVSGVWHGAGYQFILWGAMHGVYLVINHAWRFVRPRIWPDRARYERRFALPGLLLTLLAVVFAMVMFRAPSAGVAVSIWRGMAGLGGVDLPHPLHAHLAPHLLDAIGIHASHGSGSDFLIAVARVAVLLAIALLLPNTLQLLARYEPALGVRPPKPAPGRKPPLAFRPTFAWAAWLTVVASAALLSLGELSEFLYWQF